MDGQPRNLRIWALWVKPHLDPNTPPRFRVQVELFFALKNTSNPGLRAQTATHTFQWIAHWSTLGHRQLPGPQGEGITNPHKPRLKCTRAHDRLAHQPPSCNNSSAALGPPTLEDAGPWFGKCSGHARGAQAYRVARVLLLSPRLGPTELGSGSEWALS